MTRYAIFFCWGLVLNPLGAGAQVQGRVVTRAERFVAAGRLPEALTAYREARRGAKSFARYVWNELELAGRLQDSAAFGGAAVQAVELGVPYERILGLAARTETAFGLPPRTVDSLQRAYFASLDTVLRDSLLRMVNRDQAYRNRYYRTLNPFKRRKIGRAWRALNAVQVETIKTITRQHGFPGERLIGLDRAGDYPNVRPRRLASGAAMIILVHHFSERQPFDRAFWAGVFARGEMDKYQYASLLDFVAQYGETEYRKLRVTDRFPTGGKPAVHDHYDPVARDSLNPFGWFTDWYTFIY